MKKRRISLFRITSLADRQNVLNWLTSVHQKEIIDTGHFDKVLIFPADNEGLDVTVIAIAKSIEDCDSYEAENLPAIKESFFAELITPGRVEMLASYSCTEQAA